MYYPEQRFAAELLRIRRTALLPDIALGNIQVKEGQVVDVRDTVARGLIPARHIIIHAAEELHLRNPENLKELMLVNLRARVEEGQPIAGQDATRGRRVLAPVKGIIIYVGEGRIIMQEMPEIISLEAGVRGRVTRIYEGRGVAVEATGAIIQGVWGNDRNIITTMRMEPERGGINSISPESLDTTFKNEIVITRHPLQPETLEIAQARGFSGIIAPSMDATMLDAIMNCGFAVMLTAGFGSINMNSNTLRLLQQFNGSQALLDAARPERFTDRRPELIINRPTNEQVPDLGQQPLEEGVRVRITREPYAGEIGTIEEIPPQPVLLENGLRLRCAVIELMAGEFVDVPLSNLELAGA